MLIGGFGKNDVMLKIGIYGCYNEFLNVKEEDHQLHETKLWSTQPGVSCVKNAISLFVSSLHSKTSL